VVPVLLEALRTDANDIVTAHVAGLAAAATNLCDFGCATLVKFLWVTFDVTQSNAFPPQVSPLW